MEFIPDMPEDPMSEETEEVFGLQVSGVEPEVDVVGVVLALKVTREGYTTGLSFRDCGNLAAWERVAMLREALWYAECALDEDREDSE